jgi:prepilin-type processing-associated H-X9-DG protein
MTIFPPNNGPNCLAGTISGFDQSLNISTASSYHMGGVNCLMVDGAVRFISETIDSRSPNIPADYSVPSGMTTLIVAEGPSSFGVWGALGSIAGGESASVP